MLVSAEQQRELHVYIHSLPLELPSPDPSRPSQSTRLSPLCCTAASHWRLFSFPHRVQKSVLCVCVLPCKKVHQFHFLDSIHMLSTQYFFFWFSSLCIRGSKFIYLSSTDLNVFLLWMSNIPLCICTTTSLSICQRTFFNGRNFLNYHQFKREHRISKRKSGTNRKPEIKWWK